jgi:PAS domain S-box-containing protein
VSLYLALPLFACIASSVIATAIFCRPSKHRASRKAAWLLSGAATVAAYEVLWTTQIGAVLAASLTILASMVAWQLNRYGSKQLDSSTFSKDVLEALPDGVAMLGLNGRIRSGNTAMAKLLGCELPGLIGLDAANLFQEIDIRELKELVNVECAIGNALVPVSISSTTLRDPNEAPIGIVVVARDLRELEALRGHLVVSGRLAAVGELAAGIAHEINNPLAFVRANLSLLHQHWEELGSQLEKAELSDLSVELLAEGTDMIEESLEGVDRASSIVRDVKGLAHAGRGQRSMADLNNLLDGVLRMAAPQLRSKVVVEKNYGVLPLVSCAPQELQQVFLNLIINAEQSISDKGSIRVRTEAHPHAVMVWIEDDGCGIPPELFDRIFDPFFTTKPVGEGTGLGLGIAHEIVRKHEGELRIDSTSESGTTFCVGLPIEVEQPESN